ncbi:MAG: hypothetical protein IH624_02065 [Phycisphaerae bacterium]|nr:hypothetical protein [Phycisphaerae bacterium]
MKYKSLYLTVALLCCVVLAGCEQPVKTTDVFGPYYMTTLKLSTSSDVVNALTAREGELVSQSGSVVASYGTAERGTELWFNMAAFDEDSLAAVRKYAMIVDESTSLYIMSPKRSLRLDAQAVVPASLSDEPYESEGARRIAILKMLRRAFNDDMGQVSYDSANLRSAALSAMNALNMVVQTLEASPALGAQLERLEGMSFDSMNMGPGRVRMVLQNDIATVKIKAGAAAEGFENQPDVRNM